MFALIYYSPAAAVMTTMTYLAVILTTAIVALAYRREVVSCHRASPRLSAATIAVVLAVVLGVSSTDALTSVPGCMTDGDLSTWCRILSWLY